MTATAAEPEIGAATAIVPNAEDLAGDAHGERDQIGDDRRGDAGSAEALEAHHHAQSDDLAAGASGPPWPVLRASCPRQTLARFHVADQQRGRLSESPHLFCPVPARSSGRPAGRCPAVMPAAGSAGVGPGHPGRIAAGVVPAAPGRSAPM